MIPKPYTGEQPAESEVTHLPDILFVNYCFETFGLNRGIYNTIDQWLYEFGYANIMHRRQIIVTFLNEAHRKYGDEKNNAILRFGKGGLTRQLYEFVQLSGLHESHALSTH